MALFMLIFESHFRAMSWPRGLAERGGRLLVRHLEGHAAAERAGVAGGLQELQAGAKLYVFLASFGHWWMKGQFGY